MQELIDINILLPFIAAVLVYFIKNTKVRNVIIYITAVTVIFSAIGIWTHGSTRMSDGTIGGLAVSKIIEFADLLLGLYILYISFSLKNVLLIVLSLLQIVPMFLFERFSGANLEVKNVFYIDHLSIIINLIVSIIGTLIWIFAISYMKEDEEHKKIVPSRQNRFFFVLMLFVGAMNALVFSNSLLWLYFFWEITTLSSFLLIGHDRTADAMKSAVRALLLNSIGGVAFVVAIISSYYQFGTIDMQKIIMTRPVGLLLIPIVLLCFAGFTKSAQMPFQSWLLGAMVAPTPVSALLHSSTMVKAGVYLIIRLAPAFRGTWVSDMVAVFGAFTFVMASLLAIGQSNGKRVLAYSTIANLGLIIAAAGIDTPASIAAGILLIIFHAISKGLLFLCVGTIEHHIGSRDIEDMRGLYPRMPFTTVVTIIGLITMLLPPFGVLLSKWLILEVASSNPILVFLITIGSALTVLYYARWIGILLSDTASQDKVIKEIEDFTTRLPLTVLAAGAILVSLFITHIYNALVAPEIMAYYKTLGVKATQGTITVSIGAFSLLPIFIAMAVALILGFLSLKKAHINATPYMCGETVDDYKVIKVAGKEERVKEVVASNYYFHNLTSERLLTPWADLIAILLIIALFGVMVL